LVLGACALGVAVTATPFARARDPVAAEALFSEARAAVVRGDYAVACAKLAESQRLDPAPGTLLNLGDCKEHLGLYASAWAHYHEALDLLVAGPAPDEARVRHARGRIAALEPKLSRLAIVLPAKGAERARVTRDGVELRAASLGDPLPLDAGAHVVVVAAPGHADARYDVRLAEAETKTLKVELGLAGAGSAEPAAEPASGLGAARTVGLVLIGVSIASVAAGAVTGIMTLDRQSTMNANCRDQLCNPAGMQAASDGRTLSTLSTATFVGGAAGLALGAYLVITGPRWAGAPSVTLQPSAGPGAGGLRVTGAF
jgi:hypothetical protein